MVIKIYVGSSISSQWWSMEHFHQIGGALRYLKYTSLSYLFNQSLIKKVESLKAIENSYVGYSGYEK